MISLDARRSTSVDRGPSLSLALQGGGSFGAFTWGFLDRLLEAENVAIDVVSGASAGALNAVLLADGLTAGGPREARKRLQSFWCRLGHSGQLPVGPGQSFGLAAAFHLSSQLASPYQFNPLGLNPLRRLLANEIDFDRLRAQSAIRLLIAATRVKDGRLRLFREDEVTLESVLASTCLPMLHHAVEIGGEAYWDGGYCANPPLRQLVVDLDARDVILIQLLPDEFGVTPRMCSNISRRMQEIAFSTSLHRELEALEDLREVCRGSPLAYSPLGRKLRDLRFHRVVAADTVRGLAQESAMNTRWSLLCRLKEDGRRAASTWLEVNHGRSVPRPTAAKDCDRIEDIDPRPSPQRNAQWRPLGHRSTRGAQPKSVRDLRPHPNRGAIGMAAFDGHRVGYRPHQNPANAVDAEWLPPETPLPRELSARIRVPLERDAVLVERRAVNESAEHDAHNIGQVGNIPTATTRGVKVHPATLSARLTTRSPDPGDCSATPNRLSTYIDPSVPPQGLAEHVLAYRLRIMGWKLCTSLLVYLRSIPENSARVPRNGLAERPPASVLSSRSPPDQPDPENGGPIAANSGQTGSRAGRQPNGAFGERGRAGGLYVG